MKIESIKIHNFKAIKSYSGKIGGKNVYLIGGNGKGKTSFIDAVFKGLSPKNMPKVPITDNGKKGLIEVDLGDFIARTKFKKGRPVEFELENKNFETEADKFMKSPRSYMERRIGILDFDINDFLALSGGYSIIVGRAGHVIASDIKNALHVRLTAPLEYRINTIQINNELNREEAILFIKRVEKERIAFRKAIRVDNLREDLFDLTLNRASFTNEEIVDIIEFTLDKKCVMENAKAKIQYY